MSTDYDPDETLAAYGYGSKPGKGKTIAIVLLTLLLLAAAGGAGFLGKLWSDEQSKSLDLERQVKTFQTVVSELEGKNAELSSLLADKQAESERLQQEWTTQVETLKKEHAEQLQRTYAQMNDILYDSRSTLEYIGDIETRLKSGQKIDREEAAKLTGVINGLAFLHQQYGKPLNEFRELDRYFSRQIASLPANEVDPKETASPLKKIFKSKEFKEERDTFLENQGRRDALVEARSTVSAAYASAQKQMADISLDINQYLAQLQQVVDSNEAAGAEVDAFFEKSKEILKIHDRIMSIRFPSSPPLRRMHGQDAHATWPSRPAAGTGFSRHRRKQGRPAARPEKAANPRSLRTVQPGTEGHIAASPEIDSPSLTPKSPAPPRHTHRSAGSPARHSDRSV
jgi:uncharacterized protein YukE